MARAKRWTREEYERLVAAGAFAPDARIQLIDGEIVEIAQQGAAHATTVRRLQKALERVFERGYDVRAQLPLALADDPMSNPEPDIAVVTGAIDDYRDHHPSRTVLVVEVADTSLEFDRTRKLAMYARAGVPEYWIVNIFDRLLELYLDPDRNFGTYRIHNTLRAAEEITPASVHTIRIPVGALLP